MDSIRHPADRWTVAYTGGVPAVQVALQLGAEPLGLAALLVLLFHRMRFEAPGSHTSC